METSLSQRIFDTNKPFVLFQPDTLPFRETIELVSKTNIPVIVDCKHYDAWPIIEETIDKIGAHRCLVHSFASELKFDYNHNDHDYLTEWSPIKNLFAIKDRFPSVTTTASCKFLPNDLLHSDQHDALSFQIREVLKNSHIDTLCLNVPDNTMSGAIIDFFLTEQIIPHVGIDGIDIAKLTKLYVGETDILTSAYDCKLLGY